MAHVNPITGSAPQRVASRQPQILLGGWLDIIAMSGLPDGTPAGAAENGSHRQTNSSGGVIYLPESPDNSYYDQAAAPTSGERQVLSEDPSINFETEVSEGHDPQ